MTKLEHFSVYAVQCRKLRSWVPPPSILPAGGNLIVAFGNSKRLPAGNKFKAGNSLVVSHQAVWPAVEFIFPYMCEDEFNSVLFPVGMYPQDYDWSATVSQYLIAATPEFSLHYLMPIPDFYLVAKPTEAPAPLEVKAKVGTFQSRITGVHNVVGTGTLAASSTEYSCLVYSDAATNTGCFSVRNLRIFLKGAGAESANTRVYAGLSKSSSGYPAWPTVNTSAALTGVYMMSCSNNIGTRVNLMISHGV